MFKCSSSRLIAPLVASVLCLSAGAASAAVIASSTFDADVEGWQLEGDATTAPSPNFVAAGGNPGGAIQGIDSAQGGTWRFVAPAAYRGNLSTAYGGTLSYDLKFVIVAAALIPYDASFVLIGDGTTTLGYMGAAYPTAGDWVHFDVPLTADGWFVGGAGGPAATEAQMQAVLSNVTSLRIRGEFHSGADNAFLDNVLLATAIPEPTSVALFGAALVGLALTRRRREWV